MTLYLKPQYVLFAAALLLAVLLFFLRQQTLDIQFHDTYYVIGRPVFIIPAALAVLGILYVICGQWLGSSLLTWLHVAVSVAAVLGGMIISYLAKAATPGNYGDWSSFNRFAAYNSWLEVIILVFVLAQFAFVLNVVLGTIKIMQK